MSSTPIHKIPVQTSPQPEPEDPEVLAILKEMEQSNPQAPPPATSPAYPMPPPSQPMYYPPQPQARALPAPVPESKSFLQIDLLQKAAIAAVIAFVLFYPKTLAMVYEKLPQLTAFDPFLRTFLLALVLYLVMWKLNI